MTKTRKALGLLTVGILAVSACSDSSQPDDTPGRDDRPGSTGEGADTGARADPGEAADTGVEPAPVVTDVGPGETILTARLVRFDECDALLEHLRSKAAARVGPWGFDPRPDDESADTVVDEDVVQMLEEALQEASDNPGSALARQHPQEGVDYAGTNVQKAGVDQANIIKTDGQRIFAMSAGHLVVVDAARREVLGSLLLPEGTTAELLLEGDSLLAIQQSGTWGGNSREVVVHRIDATEGRPEIVETLRVEGSYVSARSIGGVARVIVRSEPAENFPFVYPGGPSSEESAQEANKATLLASNLDDWLPAYSHTHQDGATSEGLLPPCEQVHVPTVFSGLGVTTVLSVPVAGVVDPAAATSLMGPGETFYASNRSMYISTTTWIDPSALEAGDGDLDRLRSEWRTNIHRFDISDPAGAVYTASGSVAGEIHNQFALSEHAGHLRVITTTGDRRSTESESWVRVLAESGDSLIEVGSVGDIGRGERVHSVRFVGDVGYVATVRQIDPFYMIDLSDPAMPSSVGELKILGYSSYLHPIGDTLALAFGSGTDEDGWITGTRVSLFDVSDLAAPRELAVWTGPSGWNETEWYHRAFLWWAPERTAVIPVTVNYEWSGAVMLRIADDALTEAGQIVHLGPGTGQTSCRRLNEADVIAPVDMTQADLGARVAELVVQTPASVTVVACEPGEEAIAGFQCEAGDFTEAEEESLRQWIDYSAREELWACLPPPIPEATDRQVVRSIVIGDELWTLSHPYRRYGQGGTEGLLQVNGLKTLEFLDAVDL